VTEPSHERLRRALALTRDEEIGCDDFLARLAAYVEGRPESDVVKALMDHHREICPECEEEREILARSLALD